MIRERASVLRHTYTAPLLNVNPIRVKQTLGSKGLNYER